MWAPYWAHTLTNSVDDPLATYCWSNLEAGR